MMIRNTTLIGKQVSLKIYNNLFLMLFFYGLIWNWNWFKYI